MLSGAYFSAWKGFLLRDEFRRGWSRGVFLPGSRKILVCRRVSCVAMILGLSRNKNTYGSSEHSVKIVVSAIFSGYVTEILPWSKESHGRFFVPILR